MSTLPTLPPDGLVELDGEGYYAVPAIDRMAPFFMSVVSDGDRWMFISSSGALTAGRRNAAGALFPYETDDRLHQAAGRIGPVSAIRIRGQELWTPFRGRTEQAVRRSLYKSVVGDTILFEEVNENLGMTFRYSWSSCDRFGFVRTATITNHGDEPVQLEVIDGLVNVLPHGLTPALYNGMSNLTNAYKRSEIVAGRLAVYSLEASVVDRPEPAESLRASTVWSLGLEGASLSLSGDSLTAFEAGESIDSGPRMVGKPGAYLLEDSLAIAATVSTTWRIIADAAQDQGAVAELRRDVPDLAAADVDACLDEATKVLVGIMAPADAMQRTGDRVATAHHFSNTLYNVMRGGTPLDGHRISTERFADWLAGRNKEVADRHAERLRALPGGLDVEHLVTWARESGDVSLVRLAMEYLPFSFSRRHGDPSRPWNAFSIRVKDDEGEPIVYYEGNWRDIFQNWEALAMSFPTFLPGMIGVFVNASTVDGFNPYRITSHGIDWEAPDPHDPWSNIGYWGDHQVVYLLRLLEAADRYFPDHVRGSLTEPRFTYADVPYRIAPYSELVDDPKSTIDYDESAAADIERRVDEIGADARLVRDPSGRIHHVTLLEKLLVPALSKLSNFVPGGGIWMNTQRPEWNDANNALVGYGLSMVTLYYLRRYLDHLRSIVADAAIHGLEMSNEVGTWLGDIRTALLAHSPAGDPSNEDRRALLDALGQAFGDYRATVYADGFSGRTEIETADVVDLCAVAIEHLDATIRAARRDDGLYQSYNLIQFSDDEASVEHLYEMLEGQVALLSSGVLSLEERADLIDAVFASRMYRADVGSFLLYPARDLPSFLDKNVIPTSAMEASPLLTALVAAGEHSVVTTDIDGRSRFNADFSNRDDLDDALDALSLSPAWADLVDAHRHDVLETYESVFNHHAFTGRSGSMYGYEGIGSIYWHMVAKLLLAVQESAIEAADAPADTGLVHRLVEAYWRIRAGFGFNKNAHEFGAIPIDPYSHTPGHSGAQQPGMTGLVKEELLTRSAEVGVQVIDGEIRFDPLLVRPAELLGEAETWQVIGLDGASSEIELPAGSLGVTLCQVPVIVERTGADPHVEIRFSDGTSKRLAGSAIDAETSALIFGRTGAVSEIKARVRFAG